VKRVVFDSNVIISAFQFGGKPMEVLQMAVDGEIKLFYSQPILEETRRILRDKFGYTAARLDEVTGIIETYGMRVTPTQKLDVVPSDPDDNRIVEAAVAGKCEAVVTGDKDLLRLNEYAGIKMVRVRDFIERGQGKG
jgi:putative PIN family toxin of toxin-antitoxin system